MQLEKNYCLYGGWLVGGGDKIPTDSRECYSDKEKFPFGCNNIICSLCHSQVKQWDGFRLKHGSYGQTEQSMKEIYDTINPDASAHLEKDDDARTYACKCWADTICASWSLGKSYVMIDDWHCAGHPKK